MTKALRAGLSVIGLLDLTGEEQSVSNPVRSFEHREQSYLGRHRVREIDLSEWKWLPGVVSRTMPIQQSQLQAVRLRLHRVQENARDGLPVDDALLSRVNTALVCRRKELIPFAARWVKVGHGSKRHGVSGYGLAKVLVR
jgi:hypothetical protein